jgi:hypothetical protein
MAITEAAPPLLLSCKGGAAMQPAVTPLTALAPKLRLRQNVTVRNPLGSGSIAAHLSKTAKGGAASVVVGGQERNQRWVSRQKVTK